MVQDVLDYLDRMAGMMAREFTRIHLRLDTIDQRLDRLEARMDRLEARMDRLEARMDNLEARVEGHDRRMDRLEAHFLDMRREMKSEFALMRNSIDGLTVRVEAL